MDQHGERVALVTGTSSGIGLESALALAVAGFTVVATIRDLERSTTLRERAGAADLDLDLRELDVTDPAAAEAVVAQVLADHLHIDVLVNNAGAGFVGTLEQLDLDDLRRVLETNYLSVAGLTKLVLPGMRHRGRGRVVTVTSVGGALGQPFNDAYCAAKFATEGLLESLAPVVAPHGVHISIVEPGPVATSFVDNLGDSLASRPAGPDDPYAAQWDGYLRRAVATFADAQGPDQVAEVVVRAASEPQPALRYQTSATAAGFVGVKLSDLRGRATLEMTSAWVR